MKSIKEILNAKPEITIGGDSFRLMYNNWVLKNCPLEIDLKKLSGIAGNQSITLTEKIKQFGEIGNDAINLIIAGIKTHVIIECDDLQSFDTGMMNNAAETRIKEVENYLRLGMNTAQLIEMFIICIKALADFMPKVEEGEGVSPSSLPRNRKRG